MAHNVFTSCLPTLTGLVLVYEAWYEINPFLFPNKDWWHNLHLILGAPHSGMRTSGDVLKTKWETAEEC